MTTYLVEHYGTQQAVTIQANSSNEALLRAAELFPNENAVGWLYSRMQGKEKYDRWMQMVPNPVVLERTGLVVDCFQRCPDLEDFQPPNAK